MHSLNPLYGGKGAILPQTSKHYRRVSKKGNMNFDLFWSLYPRKVAKKAALKVWNRLSEVEKKKAIDVLPDHVKAWADKELQYIPHPTTWLSQGRYDDELEVDVSELAKLRFLRGG